jgi:Ca2+-binding EF-hand superfamily protein
MKSTIRVWCGALSLVLSLTVAMAVSAEVSLPLETTVKVLRAPAPVTPAPMETPAGTRPVPAPTTPAAKHPQYRLGQGASEQVQVGNIEDAAVRFRLNLPNESVLVEARITIDGVPFAMVRRRRAERILLDLKEGTSSATDALFNAEGATNILERLRHTQEVTGETPTVGEVEWLLARWIDGPTILPLNDNFQRFRANQRPEVLVLDRDRDGGISAEEMRLAEESFGKCDRNQDGLVQFTEVAVRATDTASDAKGIETRELIEYVLDDASRERKPDLSLTIAFDTAHPEKSRMALTAVSADWKPAMEQIVVDPTGITLTLKGTPVMLSAVQLNPSDQISIGAVIDGYPLLPTLDPNDDGRLTMRELRRVPETLKTFDQNLDGTLAVDELQSPVRLCFGLGASVHRELLGIRSPHRQPTAPPITGPEWFVRMDRNKDNDLARGEFPGTDEQFLELDADRDKLVSADEAVNFDKQTADTEQEKAKRSPATPGPATSTDTNAQQEAKPQ